MTSDYYYILTRLQENNCNLYSKHGYHIIFFVNFLPGWNYFALDYNYAVAGAIEQNILTRKTYFNLTLALHNFA